MKFRNISLMLFVTFGMSCSSPSPHAPRKQDAALQESGSNSVSDKKVDFSNSSIEIQYVLGHEHYRFFALSKGASIEGYSSINKQVIEQGLIDQNLYSDYLLKVTHFIQNLQQHPQESLNFCRTPFFIILIIKDKSHSIHGCRSNDGGALSRLIRDGEFLLYSKK